MGIHYCVGFCTSFMIARDNCLKFQKKRGFLMSGGGGGGVGGGGVGWFAF